MLRLLQGDVGSGKTLVALLAMLSAVEAGGQAALMAPTEVLARQHQATLARLLAPAGLAPALLTGRERGAARAGACWPASPSGESPDRGRDPRAVPGGRRRSPTSRSRWSTSSTASACISASGSPPRAQRPICW